MGFCDRPKCSCVKYVGVHDHDEDCDDCGHLFTNHFVDEELSDEGQVDSDSAPRNSAPNYGWSGSNDLFSIDTLLSENSLKGRIQLKPSNIPHASLRRNAQLLATSATMDAAQGEVSSGLRSGPKARVKAQSAGRHAQSANKTSLQLKVCALISQLELLLTLLQQAAEVFLEPNSVVIVPLGCVCRPNSVPASCCNLDLSQGTWKAPDLIQFTQWEQAGLVAENPTRIPPRFSKSWGTSECTRALAEVFGPVFAWLMSEAERHNAPGILLWQLATKSSGRGAKLQVVPTSTPNGNDISRAIVNRSKSNSQLFISA